MELINDFLEYQASFKGMWLEDYIKVHEEIPVFLVIAYLTLVFYIPEIMTKKNPVNLRPFFMGWNLLLAIFSCFGAYYTVPTMVSTLMTHGYRYSVCQNPALDYYHNGACGLWVALFILSKIPELLDTVFLVLQKKDVIFLHWFHHVTVMLYCWHAYSHRIGSGLWFATMNYVVHSIMYTYYFVMCFAWGRKLVRPIAVYITTLQIMQMIMGMTVTVSAFLYFDPQVPGSCHQQQANMRMGLIMYSSYFVLFGSLFHKNYIGKGKKHKTPSEGNVCNASEETTKAFIGARKQD
jgi:elongation of very long chain fatty acids protein 6